MCLVITWNMYSSILITNFSFNFCSINFHLWFMLCFHRDWICRSLKYSLFWRKDDIMATEVETIKPSSPTSHHTTWELTSSPFWISSIQPSSATLPFTISWTPLFLPMHWISWSNNYQKPWLTFTLLPEESRLTNFPSNVTTRFLRSPSDELPSLGLSQRPWSQLVKSFLSVPSRQHQVICKSSSGYDSGQCVRLLCNCYRNVPFA